MSWLHSVRALCGRFHRSTICGLSFAMVFAVCVDGGIAGAQTVNPRVVSFVPSPDHDAVGSDSQPVVSEYDLEFYAVGGTQSLLVMNLGKPAPASDGYISVDFGAMLASPPSPGQTLEARVAAVGPGGKGESSASNSFIFDCRATVTPNSFSAPAQGGSGSVSVTIYSGCSWQATSGAAWLTVTSGSGATGSGTVSFSAAANPSTTSRTGTLTVAGQAVTVTEAAAAASNVAPSVQLTSPANGATFTAPASITIAANASDSDGTVTSVAFYAGSTLIGSTASAPYGMTWSNVASGSYTITAVATDNSGAKTTSAGAAVTVKAPNVAPSVTVTSPANGATFTAPASITIAANASDSDGSVARVAFYSGSTLIGTATTAPYSVTWSNVPAGSYTITAVATDNSAAKTTSAGVAVTVKAPNAAPSVTLTGPANGATFTAPASITITASASDSDGSVASVAFYSGSTLLGTATTAPYSVTWSNVTAGSYTLTAVATDNSGAKTTSAGVAVTVKAPNVAPSVTLTGPANGATFTAPASITITASASDSDGSVASVAFYSSSTLIGTATTAPYSVTWSNVTAGSYTLTAVATDNSGAKTTSGAVSVTVSAPPTTPPSNVAPVVQVTSPANNSTLTWPSTTTITATASDADGMIARVDFYVNGTLLGSATAAPYTARWTLGASGTYTVTAKATDNSGATTSSSVTVTVRKKNGKG